MTKEKYLNMLYIGKHEKHKYTVTLWRQKDSIFELHSVYGMKELKALLSGCYNWLVNDITTGETDIKVAGLEKGTDTND